jgi:hypothetical protein
MTSTAEQAKQTAQKAEQSEEVDRLARFGLICRGLVWNVVGALFLNVAVGGGARADKQGALGVIKDQPLGEVLLALLGIGFIGYAGWRLLQGAVGHRDARGKPLKRSAKRVASLGRGLIYAALAFSTFRYLFLDSTPDRTRELTARVMDFPGGAVMVGLVGGGLVVGGLVMAVRGLRQRFDDKLKPLPGRLRPVVHVVGTVGLVSRGLVFALVGAFIAWAAVTYDPAKAKGLDAAVKTVERLPMGNWLIGMAALGLLCFGVWSFAEARWRRI